MLMQTDRPDVNINKYRWRVVIELLVARGGMKRKEIAEETGIARFSISRYCIGTSTPHKDCAAKLISLLESRVPAHLIRLAVKPDFED